LICRRESCLAAPLPGISGIYGGLQGAYFDHKVHVCSGATPNCYAYERDGSHESHESHEHNWAWNPIGPLHTTRTQVSISSIFYEQLFHTKGFGQLFSTYSLALKIFVENNTNAKASLKMLELTTTGSLSLDSTTRT